MGNLPREYLEDLSDQRFQENVARKFNQDGNTEPIGCLGGTQTSLGNNSWRVQHSLGTEPRKFVLTAQGSSSSIKVKMTNITAQTVDLVFDSDPTSFTVFLS